MAAEFKREWTNFPGKAKSVVWKYFGFWKIIKQDAPSEIMKDKAVCKLCKAEYKYSGNTTNLSQHLSKVHPDEPKQTSPATLQQTFNRNEDTSKSLPLPSKRSEEITVFHDFTWSILFYNFPKSEIFPHNRLCFPWKICPFPFHFCCHYEFINYERLLRLNLKINHG
jgi:hypothetical protein